MENERRIIYVDAGSTNSDDFKISLYDIVSNATHIMELTAINDNNKAEKYAVYYAIKYINENNFDNCMILCDNKSAVNDKVIISLSNHLNIKISWIPREINKIADKTCKLDSTLKDTDFNTLRLLVELSLSAFKNADDTEKKLKNEINKLEEQAVKLKLKVKNQATQITNLKKK